MNVIYELVLTKTEFKTIVERKSIRTKKIMERDCVVCTEENTRLLPDCLHNVHLSCIARAASTVCPICRVEVNQYFSEADQQLYRDAFRERQVDLEREDRQQALELQQEENQRPRNIIQQIFNNFRLQPNQERIRRTTVTITPTVNLATDDLVHQMFLLVQAIETNQPEVSVSEGTFRYYNIINDMRQLALELNIEMGQMIDVMNLTTNQN
jgi:hypothetical protein